MFKSMHCTLIMRFVFCTLQAVIEHCKFDTNKARWGGAVAIVHEARLLIHNSTFTKNEANFSGGAIDADDYCAINVTSSSFTSNTAVDHGGALALYCDISAVISNRHAVHQQQHH
jgi:predicted outer membrane repeat protein